MKSVPIKASQDDVGSVSAFFKCDVQWKKGHTQWQICGPAWRWPGLANPSKVRRSTAPPSWVSVLGCWILNDWGRRMKLTEGGSVRESRIKSDIILGFTRNTWLRSNMKNPKFGVCETMLDWTQRKQRSTEWHKVMTDVKLLSEKSA